MSLNLLLLFIAGLIQDALQGIFLRLAVGKHYLGAALVSIAITLIAYGVFFKLLETLTHGDPSHLMAYAVGGGAGSYLSLRYKQS